MNTNPEKLLPKEEGFQIVGCAMEVLNQFSSGLVEKPYENALVVEFGLRGIPFSQQQQFEVLYKGHKVGLNIPDLIPFSAVVVDAKVIEADYGSRAWSDAEPPPNYQASRWCNSQFQTRETGVGENRFMNSRPFVSIRG